MPETFDGTLPLPSWLVLPMRRQLDEIALTNALAVLAHRNSLLLAPRTDRRARRWRSPVELDELEVTPVQGVGAVAYDERNLVVAREDGSASLIPYHPPLDNRICFVEAWGDGLLLEERSRNADTEWVGVDLAGNVRARGFGNQPSVIAKPQRFSLAHTNDCLQVLPFGPNAFATCASDGINFFAL